MTKEEAAARYMIPVDVLDEYERWGLCGSVKQVMGRWQYDEADIERLSLIMALHDVGFDAQEVLHYMHLELEGEQTCTQRMAMIARKRSATLDEIHLREKQIERLDYLRHRMGQRK